MTTYILVIWTVVACVPAGCKSDWRALGEFYSIVETNARSLCDNAAKELNLKNSEYRCVRSK